ncbi:uncharacterized protein JCM10292_007306 [Rhodotorula paludigena]|uniref:uncharacterized protein n=1 Tax=Rhodotorula paludigena TaxID=86838 RepID=UPI003173FA99
MAGDAQGSSAEPYLQQAQTVVVREKAKRGSRACVACRRLKKTCEGGGPPCTRCKASGTECRFDRPASNVVEDAGLTRLSAIEAALSTNERRMDSVVQQIGEISNVLTDVLSRLKHLGPSTSHLSPGSNPDPSNYAPTYGLSQAPGAAGSAAFAPLAGPSSASLPSAPLAPASFPPFSAPPLRRPSLGPSSSSAGNSPQLVPPYPPHDPGAASSPAAGGSAGAGVSPGSAGPHASSFAGIRAGSYPSASGLDALASLASRSSQHNHSPQRATGEAERGDVHRFASRLRQPISALADAVAQLGGGSGSGSEEGDDENGEEGARGERGRGAREGMEREEEEEGKVRFGSAGPGEAGERGNGDGRAGKGPLHGSSNGAGVSASKKRPESKDRRDGALGGTPDGSRGGGSPPRKRSRLHVGTHGGLIPSPEQFDLVAKGLIGDQEARGLVLLWHKECQPFCAVIDEGYDTYESLRRRSPFLFNVILYTALRMSERNNPPSKQLIAAAEETRRFARDSVFMNDPQLEVVQAMLVMACYHQEPYILSGMSLRLALSARMETCIEQLEAHGWHKTDEKARRLTAQIRTWIYATQIEMQHARNMGRMCLLDERDMAELIAKADRALSLPFLLKSDFRHIGNLRLSAILRQIMQDTATMAQHDPSFAEQIAYVNEKKQLLQDWYSHYDGLIASWEPSTLAWPRKSHYRMWHDAQLTLIVSVFRQKLLDRPATASYELTQIVQDALSHARVCLQSVLGSPVYRSGTRWSGYLLRVDMTFAAIFQLKSAAAWPNLVDREEVAKDVALLADLLAGVAGSLKYSAMLRAAREQFLNRTAPAPSAPATPSAFAAPDGTTPTTGNSPTAAMARTATSAPSMRNLLGPPVQSTSTTPLPLSNFAPSLPPGSAFPSPSGFTPVSTAVPFTYAPAYTGAGSYAPMHAPAAVAAGGYDPSTTATGGFGSVPGFSPGGMPGLPGAAGVGIGTGGTAALMPGELEFDWSLAIPPSLFDDSFLAGHDWTATANWLDGL